MAIAMPTDRPMFIDGVPAESSSGEWIEVHSPATGTTIHFRQPAILLYEDRYLFCE